MSENQELETNLEQEEIENEIPEEFIEESDEQDNEQDNELEFEDNESDDDSQEDEHQDKPKKELPDWAVKNPKAWGAKMAKQAKREAKKEYEESLSKLREEFDGKLSQFAPKQSEQPVEEAPQLGEDEFYDEEIGAILNKNTPEGMYSLLKKEHEKKKIEAKALNNIVDNHRNAENNKNQTMKVIKDFVDHDLTKFIDENPNTKENFEKIAINPRLKSSIGDFIDFASNLPNNGPEFLHYLSKNEKELERLSVLDSRLRQRELMRHNNEFNARNRVSKAPPPSGQGGATISNTSSLLSLKEMQKHLHDKYRNTM